MNNTAIFLLRTKVLPMTDAQFGGNFGCGAHYTDTTRINGHTVDEKVCCHCYIIYIVNLNYYSTKIIVIKVFC